MRIMLRIAAFLLFVVSGALVFSLLFYMYSGGELRHLPKALAMDSAVTKRIMRVNQGQTISVDQSVTATTPNIVVVLTDDDAVGSTDHMPFLKRKTAESGLRFTNGIVTIPECCPYRASFLSGGYHAKNTGVLSNGWPNGSIERFDENNGLAPLLQSVGFRTGMIGKYLHGYAPGYVPPGWSNFVANSDGGMLRDYYRLHDITYGSSTDKATYGTLVGHDEPIEEYITTFQFDEAIEFISEGDAERPFFLYLSLYAPHNPFLLERPEDKISPAALDYPCVDQFETRIDPPAWMYITRERFPKDKDCGGSRYRKHVGLLQSVDRNMERLFSTLSTETERETVLIYTADNGMEYGRNYISNGKGTPYNAVRVPLLMFHPELEAGTTDRLVVSNLDVPVTLMDVAGIDVRTDGRSLLAPGIEDRRVLIENYGYLKWKRQGGLDMPPLIWAGVQTPRDKLIVYGTGEVEYFDLVEDRLETQNRAKDPTVAARVAELLAWVEGNRGTAIIAPPEIRLPLASEVSHRFERWDRNGDGTWSIVEGALPPGLSLDSDLGILSGAATEAGSYDISIRLRSTSWATYANRPQEFIRRLTVTVGAAANSAE